MEVQRCKSGVSLSGGIRSNKRKQVTTPSITPPSTPTSCYLSNRGDPRLVRRPGDPWERLCSHRKERLTVFRSFLHTPSFPNIVLRTGTEHWGLSSELKTRSQRCKEEAYFLDVIYLNFSYSFPGLVRLRHGQKRDKLSAEEVKLIKSLLDNGGWWEMT